jgi:hypothetical protein
MCPLGHGVKPKTTTQHACVSVNKIAGCKDRLNVLLGSVPASPQICVQGPDKINSDGVMPTVSSAAISLIL